MDYISAKRKELTTASITFGIYFKGRRKDDPVYPFLKEYVKATRQPAEIKESGKKVWEYLVAEANNPDATFLQKHVLRFANDVIAESYEDFVDQTVNSHKLVKHSHRHGDIKTIQDMTKKLSDALGTFHKNSVSVLQQLPSNFLAPVKDQVSMYAAIVADKYDLLKTPEGVYIPYHITRTPQ
mgnify:CR=1 FL=1